MAAVLRRGVFKIYIFLLMASPVVASNLCMSDSEMEYAAVILKMLQESPIFVSQNHHKASPEISVLKAPKQLVHPLLAQKEEQHRKSHPHQIALHPSQNPKSVERRKRSRPEGMDNELPYKYRRIREGDEDNRSPSRVGLAFSDEDALLETNTPTFTHNRLISSDPVRTNMITRSLSRNAVSRKAIDVVKMVSLVKAGFTLTEVSRVFWPGLPEGQGVILANNVLRANGLSVLGIRGVLRQPKPYPN